MKRAVIAALVLVSFGAMAQTEKSQKGEPKVQHMDLTGTEIDGTRLVSGAGWVSPKPKPTFENMIKIRATFTPELQKSVESL